MFTLRVTLKLYNQDSDTGERIQKQVGGTEEGDKKQRLKYN